MITVGERKITMFVCSKMGVYTALLCSHLFFGIMMNVSKLVL